MSEDTNLAFRLFSEVKGEPLPGQKYLANSEIVNALSSPVQEIRNCALIIAKRRGIQVVEVE